MCCTSLNKMLRLCVLSLFFSYVLANSLETWPFTLADKYIEEFKSSVNELKHFAESYEQFQQSSASRHTLTETPRIPDEVHYDFIIIGGGTSGSVLASRLSEIPEWKVLLLEAGDIETTATRVPANWEYLRNTHYNWAFKTTPQNHTCLSMKDHKCTIPSGKALGGSSAINSMVYTRGNPRDFDTWADLSNKDWCWDDVHPIFKKIEDANFEPFDKKHHHRGGLQHLEHPQYLTYLADHALEAAKELGIHVIDYNGKHQQGVSIPQLISDCGRRYSTASAYLDRTAKRKNLVVRPLSQVLKVLISPHTKEVQGVEYLHAGKIFVAKAEKEVILAAGAVNTPKILLLSGIGPKHECEQHGIDSVLDLKVGHNLKTRPSFIGLDFLYKEGGIEIDEYKNSLEYLKDGKGPLTAPGIEAILFAKTNVTKTPDNYPDVELQFVTQHTPKYEDFAWTHLAEAYYNSVWKPIHGKKIVKIIVALNHPVSHGIVKLASNDPLDPPIVEPHFFSDENEIDYRALLKGIHKAIELSHTEAFHKLGLSINPHPVHGCEETKFGSESYWECAVKYLVVPTEDVSGTARMGPSTDHEAVVDNKLRVYGVHKLRVADASVIPVSITGNLMATSILIGEKAAHYIIEEWHDY